MSFGSHGLYGLNMQGDLIWERDFGQMQTRHAHGEGSSPVLHDDRLIVNWDHEGDSFIAVFDKKTGEEVWRRPRDEVTSWSTPIVVTVDGRPQIIVNATTASRGYDLETGDVIWSLSGMTVNCIPHPIHVDGVVYLMSGYRGQMLQAVRLAGARGELEGTKHVQWTHRRNTSYVPSGAFHDGRLYFLRGNNGVLSCLDGNTGEVIYEGQRLRGLRSVYASPVCADGRIYVTSRDGVTVVFDHGPEFKQLALNRIDEPVDASMAVVGDAIYLRGHRHLYCICEVPSGGGAPRDPAPEEQASKGSALERVGSLGEGEERTASLSFGDLDLDGDMDVVVANGRHWAIGNEVYLNLEKGKFAEPRPLVPGATRSYAAPLADLDGDGDLDMVVGNDRQPSFVVWNEGGGRFRRGPDIGRVTNTRSVALADVDGKDGVDVIFVNRRDQNLICFNDGKGGFGRQAVFGRKSDATIRVATADLDGDGDLDLVAANRNGQQKQVYINDGKGSFDVSRPYGTGDDNTRGVAVADLDGDGHLDIVNANIGQPDAIYYGDGAGGFPRREVLAGAAASYAVVVADLDGDHRPDIVVANGRGRNTVWMQRAPGRFDAVPFGSRDGVTYDVVAGDLDGDGRPELATANSGSRNHVYRYVER